MEETSEQKRRRLYGKQYLAKYLAIIKKITTYRNQEDIRLLTIVDTDIILRQTESLEKGYISKIPFNNKEELKTIIRRKCTDETPIYLYTDLSKDCGIVFLNSINEFNLEFNFEDEPTGLIILIGLKSEYKILLDFYEEDEERFMEIEYYR
ncbi:hypothetical protein FAZ15_21915 [Sphingobacterium olei]|uniref:Uncharacterized protein n=1 Tax=Sphingobacterium olei TaxID=2571155 RepID=A0A4U0NJ19_9SPHI|nr:hypothetical protein [Sphingobacterium olei]TJZ49884.1 hypothetical protein FAZ15_21915 [Sphingobacterium olei]